MKDRDEKEINQNIKYKKQTKNKENSISYKNKATSLKKTHLFKVKAYLESNGLWGVSNGGDHLLQQRVGQLAHQRQPTLLRKNDFTSEYGGADVFQRGHRTCALCGGCGRVVIKRRF